jgi:hypothetical protein
VQVGWGLAPVSLPPTTAYRHRELLDGSRSYIFRSLVIMLGQATPLGRAAALHRTIGDSLETSILHDRKLHIPLCGLVELLG